MRPVVYDREEFCSKCGEKVGYYVITGRGYDDWGYKKDKFCSNCGEPVDRETEHLVRILNAYSCGHMETKSLYIKCYDEDFRTKHKEKEYSLCSHNCPICELKEKAEKLKAKYERTLKAYKHRTTHHKDTEYLTKIPEEFKDMSNVSELIKAMKEQGVDIE